MSLPSFSEFYRLVWGREPYRWQVRLAEFVCREGRWPDGLDLPTGCGKTSTLDIAVYALARGADDGAYGRFPRRIFLVVDRRVLVDQAWEHGTTVLRRVEEEPALRPFREALRRLCPDPPSCIRLRGACPTDPRWCRSVDEVQIITSTVDQVGSRLLMRGYGASPRMRAVEAGLVGNDCLLLLDEAHLSGPLLDTLGRLRKLRPVRGIEARTQVVCMTATPGEARDASWFRLQEEDDRDPVLADRLDARRTLQWSTSKPKKLLRESGAGCLLMVANTVKTALKWWGFVEKSRERAPFLVTGRMRALDRREVIASIEERLASREPTVVVATQCVEAGVDWDFDGMISECASWDALVQRLGRVNRAGRLGEGEAVCTVVPATRSQKGKPKTCPVYGGFELETAGWLESREPVSCAPGDLPGAPDGCVRPADSAPLLLPEYLDLWSQNRADGPAFDVSAFLHGARADRDVHVVWRDLDLGDAGHLQALLGALPPSNLEAVRVSARGFREWIGERPFLRLGAKAELASGEIAPGTTVVVPAAYGGLGVHGTFDGSSDRVVEDRCADALAEHRSLRFEIHPAPDIEEEEPLATQVSEWIEADGGRRHLKKFAWVDLGPRWLFVSRAPRDGDNDGSSFRASSVELEAHLNGVAARVEATAARLGLASELGADLALAARLHDVGKLDARFQRMLGRRMGGPPLAKSGGRRDARESVSDYPKGERHESLSVEIIRRHGLLAPAHDPELVEHLVASHHGWARPFIRAPQGAADIVDTVLGLDARAEALRHGEPDRAPGRFRSVQERFGWHGLAWLEGILQLCDHRQSEAEERGEVGPQGGPALVAGPSMLATASSAELRLPTLSGMIPGEFLAALGVLHALHLTEQEARLQWRGTVPVLRTALAMGELTEALERARGLFGGCWPGPLNKMEEDERRGLLASVDGPFRALVVALLSQGGRSDLDFVSGGRGCFRSLFVSATGHPGKGFGPDDLRATLVGPRTMVTGKSFRWSPLAAQGASRPGTASNDKRSEPWLEWLAMMGAAAFVAVPVTTRWGDLRTRTSAFLGSRLEEKRMRWPLWRTSLCWLDLRAAVAALPSGLRDATWCEAERLVLGTEKNRVFGFGPGRLVGAPVR